MNRISIFEKVGKYYFLTNQTWYRIVATCIIAILIFSFLLFHFLSCWYYCGASKHEIRYKVFHCGDNIVLAEMSKGCTVDSFYLTR